MNNIDPIIHECESFIGGKKQIVRIKQSQMDALNNLLNNIISKEEAHYILDRKKT
jgi:hypothetical protein